MPDDADLAVEVGLQSTDGDTCIGDRALDGEQWHDRHPQPDGDQPLRREVVVASEHDVGLGAHPFECPGDACRARVADRHRDHSRARQLGEIDGVRLRQWVIGGRDQHLRIADQFDHRVRIVERGHVGERQIRLAGADQPLDIADDRFVVQLDVDVGPRGEEQGERRWQQPVAGRLKGADPQHAGIACSHRIEVGLRRSKAGDDVTGVLE